MTDLRLNRRAAGAGLLASLWGAAAWSEESEAVDVRTFGAVGDGMTKENPEVARLMPSDDGRMHMLGLRRDLPRLLTALDVVLSGSLDEGFPNAVAEAMSAGACPVVTDVGDSQELVGDIGAVARSPSFNDIHAALRQVLSLEPGELKSQGEAARNRVELRFSLAKAAQTYIAMWRDVGDRTA